ncbi:hypothetical protein KGM_204419 [Danaus plexippus plexippus]|uniref:Uncharacterized protein n=1 Tax=Danaus plexippus plexippus TaxID=278856 RepID=A0A212ELJ5_DANPL|nr:hypothetical protein KGM_204419 [Danaus plexippus plexippus]
MECRRSEGAVVNVSVRCRHGDDDAVRADASAMNVMFCSAMIDEPQVIQFTADRPFFVAIVSNETIYFTATYRGN